MFSLFEWITFFEESHHVRAHGNANAISSIPRTNCDISTSKLAPLRAEKSVYGDTQFVWSWSTQIADAVFKPLTV